MDFKETIELASLSEQMGYDCVTVAEHHNADGYPPQPLVALAALATRTTRIQLVSNIVILPLYHPVIVAEQAAMVQFISEGRLICGVGLGYVPDDFESLGVPYGERSGRMEESLALLPRLWRETDVSHVGKFFEFARDSASQARCLWCSAAACRWLGRGRDSQSGPPYRWMGARADGRRRHATTLLRNLPRRAPTTWEVT